MRHRGYALLHTQAWYRLMLNDTRVWLCPTRPTPTNGSSALPLFTPLARILQSHYTLEYQGDLWSSIRPLKSTHMFLLELRKMRLQCLHLRCQFLHISRALQQSEMVGVHWHARASPVWHLHHRLVLVEKSKSKSGYHGGLQQRRMRREEVGEDGEVSVSMDKAAGG